MDLHDPLSQQETLLGVAETFNLAPSSGCNSMVTLYVAGWIATGFSAELPSRCAELVHELENCLHGSMSIRGDKTILVPKCTVADGACNACAAGLAEMTGLGIPVDELEPTLCILLYGANSRGV